MEISDSGNRRGLVIISNGHGKFHMIYAAQGAEQHGMLERLITAAYPTAAVKRILKTVLAVINSDRLRRWMLRQVEGVPQEKIRACTLSEPFNQLAVRFPRYGCNGSGKPQLDALAFRIYRRSAMKFLRDSEARLYHCRSGYGGPTIGLAREKKMTVLVDHSIAHPQALMQLMESGKYDPMKRSALPPMWKSVQDDIEDADSVLVNSDFVRKTLLDYEIPGKRIIVQYLGIDSEIESYFRNHAGSRSGKEPEIRFLFAGGVGRRKGADILLDVAERLPESGWLLTLAGGIEMELKRRISSLRNPNIRVLGAVMRERLVELMLDHDVFVFPTLAEGSARVVFEAMAAGMAVITTPNAGSVVEHDTHGYLIDPGDRTALFEAMTRCFNNRNELRRYGAAAKELVFKRYHSGVYRDAIAGIYSALMNKTK